MPQPLCLFAGGYDLWREPPGCRDDVGCEAGRVQIFLMRSTSFRHSRWDANRVADVSWLYQRDLTDGKVTVRYVHDSHVRRCRGQHLAWTFTQLEPAHVRNYTQETLAQTDMADNTSSYPSDTVVMITDTIGSQSWQGSGVLISPDEVLTASHVVYIQGVGTANNIVVTPGYNNGSSPYGSADGTYFHYFPIDDANRSITNQQSQYDYAVIHLSTPFTSAGYMGIAPNFAGGSVNITGYPSSAGGAQVDSTQKALPEIRTYTLLDGTALGEGSSGGQSG